MTETEGRMSLLEHLTELRTRVIRIVIAVAVGAVVCWVFYPQILDILKEPYCRSLPESTGNEEDILTRSSCLFYQRDPLEGLSVRFTVAGYGGLALATPVLLWQLWRFVAPGLYAHERKYAVPFVLSGVTLFVLGAGLAYWSIPRALEFLIDVGGPDFVNLFSPLPYIKFVVKMMVAFGIGFQFPILLIFLQLAGLVQNETLRKGRRYALVGIVILVAVLTPSGDPITLLALAIPMYLFYEIAILYGLFRARRQKKAMARPDTAGV